MVSEWFREVPDDPGSVRNGFGHIWKVWKDRKVMEGSGRVQDILGYLKKSGWFHNRCSHVCLKGQVIDPKSNSDSKKEAVLE